MFFLRNFISISNGPPPAHFYFKNKWGCCCVALIFKNTFLQIFPNLGLKYSKITTAIAAKGRYIYFIETLSNCFYIIKRKLKYIQKE